MFTGIIEEVGKIKNIQGGTNYKLTIAASKILETVSRSTEYVSPQ